MIQQIIFGDISVDVEFKDVKYLRLGVHPSTGKVRVSAPFRTKMETIRSFVNSKLEWIKRHQRKVRNQARETQSEYVDQESHLVWGRRYLLKVIEKCGPASIELKDEHLVLIAPPETSRVEKQAMMESWYRDQVQEALPPLIARWQQVMAVTVDRYSVRGMKTRWGSCTPAKRSIRLNTELAKKPRECLEHVLVHEMAHLLEPSHNATFVKHMNHFLPNWKKFRKQLRELPVDLTEPA